MYCTKISNGISAQFKQVFEYPYFIKTFWLVIESLYEEKLN